MVELVVPYLYVFVYVLQLQGKETKAPQQPNAPSLTVDWWLQPVPLTPSSSSPARPRRTCQDTRARITRASCVLLFHSAGQPTHSERFPTSVSAAIGHPRTRARARSGRTLAQRAASWECSGRTSRRPPSCAAPSQRVSTVFPSCALRSGCQECVCRAGKRGAAVRGPRSW